MKPPAFQFYADDFLAGTIDMSDEEIGIYIKLLCVQWSRGGVSDRAAGAISKNQSTTQDVLALKFARHDDGQWRNARLERVREIQADRKQNGSKGGSKTQANAQANAQAKLNPPSPSPSPTPYTKLTTKGASNKLNRGEWELLKDIEGMLGSQWVNDAGKWVNRVRLEFQKAQRVMAEVQSAITESRIKTTPAQYAEQIWKEFA